MGELLVHMNSKLMTLHPFFKQMPEQILTHACFLAQTIMTAPSDIVMQRGQKAQAMYFVVRGKLTIVGSTDISRVLQESESSSEKQGNDDSGTDEVTNTQSM